MPELHPFESTEELLERLERELRLTGRLAGFSGGDGSDDGGDGGSDSDQDDDGGNDDDSNGDDDGDDLKDAGKKALDAERKRRKDAERKARDFERRLAEIEGKDKTDAERVTTERDALQKRLDEIEGKYRDTAAKSLVITAATKANAIEPDAIFALAKAHLEFDDDGEPENVDAAVAQVKKDYPSLFKASQGRGDFGNRDKSKDRDTDAVKPGKDRLRAAYAESDTKRRRAA